MKLLDRINQRARTAVYNWLFSGSGVIPSADQIEERYQSVVALARRYYDGNHKVYLTARQKEWLRLHGDDAVFTVNHCATVVDAVVERMKLTGFSVPASEQIATLLWQWMNANRIDTLQTETHRAASRDGEAFALISWNEEERRPDLVLHPRFVDILRGGDGFGMWMEYPNGNPLDKPSRAFKQWIETGLDGQKIVRRTVYYPNRIERQVWDGGEWQPYKEEGKESVVWLTMNGEPDGEPIGLPVAHFHTPGSKSDLRDIIPLQDALNKTWLDILAAGDASAFRMLITYGWIPTTDGKEPAADRSNLLQIAPGQMAGTTKPPSQAETQVIDPADNTNLLNQEERIVYRIASISHTPLSRFIATRQVAAEGTLKQQEGPLIAKVEEREAICGNAWEDAARIMLRMARAYGDESVPEEPAEISALWGPVATRDEMGEVDIATKKKGLGVPGEKLLEELGYSKEQIAEITSSEEWKTRLANLKAARVTLETTRGSNAG